MTSSEIELHLSSKDPKERVANLFSISRITFNKIQKILRSKELSVISTMYLTKDKNSYGTEKDLLQVVYRVIPQRNSKVVHGEIKEIIDSLSDFLETQGLALESFTFRGYTTYEQ